MLNNGTFLANRYEILEAIGQGGMSNVYRAKDHTLGRVVAVKVLKEEFAKDITFVTKFRAEAQSAAGLEHPNIVNIYDVGTENGLYYIVMEYVEGVTLKTYIDKKGHLNYKEVVSIAIQVGRGIEAAHNKGIIHRDIKPQNIIISKDGKVKVTDFGIAKAVSSNTQHADMMGSVHYTSPEQARNGYVSYKSDIYSLGIVMYEMATGRVPFDGDSTVAVAIQHLQSEMTPPSEYVPDLPISVERIIEKATMKSPDRRYQNMEELLIDLKKALMTPDEDFVTITSLSDAQETTRVITEDELNKIKSAAIGGAVIEEATSTIQLPEEDEINAASDENNEDGEGDDEDEEGGKRDKIITIAGIIAAIIIVVIVVFFGSKLLSNNNNTDNTTEEETEMVVVPDVSDLTEEEATEALEAEGFVVEVEEEASDEVEEGKVISQTPKAERSLAKGGTVTITVSTGPEEEEESDEITVTDVVGKKADAAYNTLSDQGLTVTRDYAYSSDVAEGLVISQSIAGGTTANKGDAITIVISQGSQQVSVPSLAGMSQSDAQAALTAVGLSLGNVTSTYSDSVAEGLVVSQSVTQGKYVDPGTSVDIVLSRGKETTYYKYSGKVTNNTEENVTYTLYDAEGEYVASWTLAGGTEQNINANNILTSTGTLEWTSESGNVSDSKTVTFYAQ